MALADVSALAGGVPAPTSAPESAPGTDTPEDDVRPSEELGTDIMRAEAMVAYTRAVLESLVAALERSQSRVS